MLIILRIWSLTFEPAITVLCNHFPTNKLVQNYPNCALEGEIMLWCPSLAIIILNLTNQNNNP